MHGTHGSLTGSRSIKTKKTYPEVELKNFSRTGIIRCSLYQTHSNISSPHSHLLVVHKEDKDNFDPHDVEVSPDLGYIVRFENMSIIHTAKKDVTKELFQKKVQKMKFDLNVDELSVKQIKCLTDQTNREAKHMNLNQVCLCFEAFEVDKKGGQFKRICEPVYSSYINNLKSALTGELKICRMSICTGSVEGNDDLILLVEKVAKNNIKVRFFEMQNGKEIWQSFGSFTEADVHHQYAIVLLTPPYRDKKIDNYVNVFVELVRESDNQRSAPLPFRYKPKDIGISRKRPRFSSSLSQSPSSTENSFELASSMGIPQQLQTLKLEPRDTRLSEESSGVFEEFIPNYNNYQLDTFLEQVNMDSNELQDLLHESVFTDTGFNYYQPELQLDGAPVKTNSQMNKRLSFHPALKLMIDTYTDRSKLGFHKTIQRVEEIFNTYTSGNENANTIVHDLCKQQNINEAAVVFKILSKLNLTNLLQKTNNNIQTPLHIACLFDQPIYIRPLIAYKCDPNVQDMNGNTALHIAVVDNLTKCIAELVSHTESGKIDANLTNNDGLAPLHLAIRRNNINILKTLLVKCNASVKQTNSRDGNNSLHLAIQQQNPKMIQILLDSCDPSTLNITNRTDHSAVDLVKTLKNPMKNEILSIIESFLPSAIKIECEAGESSEPDADESSSTEDEFICLSKTMTEEKEAFIRERIQKDGQLYKSLGKLLIIDEKWKKVAKKLKLDHLLCIWPNPEAMLKCVLGVERIEVLSVLEAFEAVDKAAANVLYSFIKKHLNYV